MPYIGKSPQFGVRNRFVYVASSGDTSVSGADANGATLTFSDGAFVDVYLNGVLLKAGTDYVTTTTNTIGSLSALNTDDEVTVIVYDVFTVADAVSATSGGTFNNAVTFNKSASGDVLNLQLAGTTIGTVGVISDRVYLEAQGSHSVALDASANDFFPGTATGTDNDNAIDLGHSAARWKSVYVGTDIRIGGTGTANALDDYEEGTYTVAATCATSGTITLKSSNRTANYTKIGRMVTVSCDARLDSVSSPQGTVQMSLPFAVTDDNASYLAAIVTHGVTIQTSQIGDFFIKANAGTSLANIHYNTTTNLGLQAQNAGLGANDEFQFNLTYFTT